jgi:hypothetical protein
MSVLIGFTHSHTRNTHVQLSALPPHRQTGDTGLFVTLSCSLCSGPRSNDLFRATRLADDRVLSAVDISHLLPPTEEQSFSSLLGNIRPALVSHKRFLLPGQQQERYKSSRTRRQAGGDAADSATDAHDEPRLSLRSAVSKLTSVLALNRALLSPQAAAAPASTTTPSIASSPYVLLVCFLFYVDLEQYLACLSRIVKCSMCSAVLGFLLLVSLAHKPPCQFRQHLLIQALPNQLLPLLYCSLQ